jgi:GNAT superfamily N-acetyltransferase
MDEPGAWTYVATADDRVIGFALGFPGDGVKDSGRESDAEYLSLLFVEPNQWGKRIASRLMDVVIERAQRDGKHELALWTRDDDNEHARGVYEHRGFALSGLRRVSRHGRQVHYQLEL